MKQLLFTLFLVINFSAYSQQNELWDVMNLPKVLINKSYTSYTIAYQKKENGVDGELIYNQPNINNPFSIIIKSDENSGKMIINNKQMTEDVIINFKGIYKDSKQGNPIYLFATNDQRFNITFFLNSESNSTIVVNYTEDTNKGLTYIYTLAKN